MMKPVRTFLWMSFISLFLLLTAERNNVRAFTISGQTAPMSNVFRSKFIANDCSKRTGTRTGTRMQEWESDSDDIRWAAKLKRRMLRSRKAQMNGLGANQVRFVLISVQVLMYIYQIITTIINIQRKFPSYWPNHSAEMIIDSVWGSSAVGPLTSAFGFSAALSKSQQPYRYFTSGLFHNSLLHLIIDIFALQRQPRWLSTGLGAPLYLTTYIGSTVFGNIAHVISSSDAWDVSIYLGSSGGICGLFGLMFVCLSRMSNANGSNGGPSAVQLIRGMAIMLLTGLFLERVSTAASIGGFIGGIIIGLLCGPRYVKDYSMRRKNSVGYDPFSRDYRYIMGFGITPTSGGLIPLKVIWGVLLTVAISIPKYRTMPLSIFRGLLHAF